MCLARITQQENLPEEVTAWKIFFVCRGQIYPAIRGGGPLLLDAWNVVTPPFILLRTDNYVPYTSGFHAYQKMEEAYESQLLDHNRKVYEVRLRKLVCAGFGDGAYDRPAQWVAREMRIVGPVDFASLEGGKRDP